MALNIKLIKTINAEELLTEIISESNDKITIKNPLKLALIPSKDNPKVPTIGLLRWAEFSDEKEFTLDKSVVIVIMNPIKELINQYNSVFGGIVQPGGSGLIIPGS